MAKHKFVSHNVTEVNGAGVQQECWQECSVCGGVLNEYEYLDPRCLGKPKPPEEQPK